MIDNVLCLIDLSQHYDNRTCTQREISKSIGINERNVRVYVKKLLDGKYMRKTPEYTKLGNMCDVKYYITPKGYRLLEENA